MISFNFKNKIDMAHIAHLLETKICIITAEFYLDKNIQLLH